MAEALVWYLIRDHNSFMVKRGQTKRDGSIQMSKEPGNLLNVHNFKYSGIANNHTIGLQEVSVPNDKRKKVPAIQVVTKVCINLTKH
jgi:large subunit ribosomal protein L28e